MSYKKEKIADAILLIDLRGQSNANKILDEEFKKHKYRGTVVVRIEGGEKGKVAIYSFHPVHAKLIAEYMADLDGDKKVITTWNNWKSLILPILLEEGKTVGDAGRNYNVDTVEMPEDGQARILKKAEECIPLLEKYMPKIVYLKDGQSYKDKIGYFDFTEEGVMETDKIMSILSVFAMSYQAFFIKVFTDVDPKKPGIYFGCGDININLFLVSKKLDEGVFNLGVLSVEDFENRVRPYLSH